MPSSSQQQRHIGGRWQAERRAEDEPDRHRRAPADGQAAEDVERQPVAPDGRGQRHQGDEDLDEALHAPRQVRQGRGRHRHEQGDPPHGETQVVVTDHDPGGPSAVAAQDHDQDPARRRGAGRAQRDVPRDHPAARDQGQRHQDDRHAERAGVVDHRHQPGDAPRRRVDDLGDGPVYPGVIADDEQAAHQRQDGSRPGARRPFRAGGAGRRRPERTRPNASCAAGSGGPGYPPRSRLPRPPVSWPPPVTR